MSNLDKYISKLMADDRELHNFLVDPIRAGQDNNGLTKAERAVLRRTLSGISHNATNGMSLRRSHDSHRRSLRLLQNVLHVQGGTHVARMNSASLDANSTVTSHVMYIYYGTDASSPGTNPYANYIYGAGTPSSSDNTVNGVLSAITSWKNSDGSAATLDYGCGTTAGSDEGCDSGNAITWFTINGTTYLAVPGDPSTSQLPFWFYSVNGEAVTIGGSGGYINSGVSYGADGESYKDYSLDSFPNEPIYWQCIAPGTDYGFDPCVTETYD